MRENQVGNCVLVFQQNDKVSNTHLSIDSDVEAAKAFSLFSDVIESTLPGIEAHLKGTVDTPDPADIIYH